MTDALGVVIVDDQALIRSGIRALLEAEPDITVLAEGTTGLDAIALAREHRPDVLLMDIQMPELGGVDATRAITEDAALAAVHVVMLTNYDADELVFDALRAGASGFLLKDTEPAELVQAIRVVQVGHALVSPSITRRLISAYVTRPAGSVDKGALSSLTRREREVVALVAQGLSNQEIAERMVVSPTTAKTHVSRAMVKLHARDRAQFVVIAYQTGLAPDLSPRD